MTDLPEGITRTEADKLFTQLAMSGAKIQWLKDAQGLPGGGGGDNGGTAENGRHSDLAALYTIVAVFPSSLAAQNASLRLNNSVSRANSPCPNHLRPGTDSSGQFLCPRGP